MNNLRLTIIMFLLAAALAPIALVGIGSAAKESMPRPAPGSAFDAATFAPAGLKQAPWEGGGKPKPAASTPPSPSAAAAPAEAFAFVELFTSEGCSSCPPADKLLSEIAAPGPASRRLVCVAYHVDYWNHLGWTDPYAEAAYTERQKAYSKTLKEDRVYTPQVVINGRVGFVGSDRKRMTEEIDKAMATTATAKLTAVLDRAFKPGETVNVGVRLAAVGGGQLPKDLRVFAAVTEDRLTSKVTRGENEGRELAHDAVCRVMIEGRVGTDGTATLELRIPGAVKADHARVAVWVADSTTGGVIAATYAVPALK